MFLFAVAALGWAGSTYASWSARLVLVAILLGSVLWHELGHALMARARKLRVSGIYLHLLPFAYVARGTPRDELRVALAGPAASLVAAGAFAAMGVQPSFEPHQWHRHPVTFAAAMNLLMGVVNLLPALPLDGGRALNAHLRARAHHPGVHPVTRVVGLVIAAGLVVSSFVWTQGATARALQLLAALLGVAALLPGTRQRTEGTLSA